MATVEFALTTNLAAVDTFEINATFDDTMKGLVAMMDPYAGQIVTADDVPTAKSDLAKIRKIKARIEDVRKDVKRQYMEPYNRFEERCKELVAVCESAENNLDRQIKGYSEAAKGEKRERLAAYFAENIGDMSDFLTFDTIYVKKWENVTYAEDKAKEDIQKGINICKNSVNAIRGLHSEFETALLDYYKQSHSLEGTLAKDRELQAMKEAEQRKREAAQARQTEQKPQARPEPRPEPVAEAPKAPEKKYTVDFRVVATREQLDELRQFLIRYGYQFGKVPKEG